MAKLSNEELLDAFKEMSLIELGDFLSKFEDTFGVTAIIPAPPGDYLHDELPLEEEKVNFDVVLTSFGDRKIQVIKVVRALRPDLTLAGARDLVDQTHFKAQYLLIKVDKDTAEAARAKLEEQGATVVLE